MASIRCHSKKVDENRQCPTCGCPMDRDLRPGKVVYKGQEAEFQQPGWYCSNCEESILERPDSWVARDALSNLKAQVDGTMAPSEVTRIRRKLGLSQREAGSLLGGGARSFQKYETGIECVTKAMANLLRLLDVDPGRLNELVGAVGTKASRKEVRPMSDWNALDIRTKIEVILEDVAKQAPQHHFAATYLTAYQIAIEFERLHPTVVTQLGLPVGGAGTGQRNSLAQYLARGLSSDIKDGRTTRIKGAFLAHLHIRELSFDHAGTVLESSVTDSQHGLSMFRFIP